MAIERVELRLNDGIVGTPHLIDDVEILQKYLKDWWGVLPRDAKIDGLFGTATKAAVERFQSLRPPGSKFAPLGLKVTGIVDQDTWAELMKVQPDQIKMIGRNAPGQKSQPAGFRSVDEILDIAQCPSEIRPFAQKNLSLVLTQCIDNGVTDRGQIAYVLATTEHESHFGRFMIELSDGWQYEGRDDLGNTQPGDGPRYKGRGFVQITGRTNYGYWGKKLNIDLVGKPEMAARPDIAAVILVEGMREGSYTGRGLRDFVEGDRQGFYHARKIVNGLDRANHIAAIARAYLKALA
jgi:predicted chitinase